MSWSSFARRVRQVVDLLQDLRHADWRERRAVRHDFDERIAAWRTLPPEDQVGFIHPASPTKPRGWSVGQYKATRRRRDEAS
jgi:hypothetical protein